MYHNSLEHSDKFKDEQTCSVSDQSVCRDFLRNVCKRGRRCKFKHPNSTEFDALNRKSGPLLCYDFINGICSRTNCKYIHVRPNEESPTPGNVSVISHPPERYLDNATLPICKDYLKGTCRRGTLCKFRHVSGKEKNAQNHFIKHNQGTLVPQSVSNPIISHAVPSAQPTTVLPVAAACTGQPVFIQLDSHQVVQGSAPNPAASATMISPATAAVPALIQQRGGTTAIIQPTASGARGTGESTTIYAAVSGGSAPAVIATPAYTQSAHQIAHIATVPQPQPVYVDNHHLTAASVLQPTPMPQNAFYKAVSSATAIPVVVGTSATPNTAVVNQVSAPSISETSGPTSTAVLAAAAAANYFAHLQNNDELTTISSSGNPKLSNSEVSKTTQASATAAVMAAANAFAQSTASSCPSTSKSLIDSSHDFEAGAKHLLSASGLERLVPEILKCSSKNCSMSTASSSSPSLSSSSTMTTTTTSLVAGKPCPVPDRDCKPDDPQKATDKSDADSISASKISSDLVRSLLVYQDAMKKFSDANGNDNSKRTRKSSDCDPDRKSSVKEDQFCSVPTQKEETLHDVEDDHIDSLPMQKKRKCDQDLTEKNSTLTNSSNEIESNVNLANKQDVDREDSVSCNEEVEECGGGGGIASSEATGEEAAATTGAGGAVDGSVAETGAGSVVMEGSGGGSGRREEEEFRSSMAMTAAAVAAVAAAAAVEHHQHQQRTLQQQQQQFQHLQPNPPSAPAPTQPAPLENVPEIDKSVRFIPCSSVSKVPTIQLTSQVPHHTLASTSDAPSVPTSASQDLSASQDQLAAMQRLRAARAHRRLKQDQLLELLSSPTVSAYNHCLRSALYKTTNSNEDSVTSTDANGNKAACSSKYMRNMFLETDSDEECTEDVYGNNHCLTESLHHRRHGLRTMQHLMRRKNRKFQDDAEDDYLVGYDDVCDALEEFETEEGEMYEDISSIYEPTSEKVPKLDTSSARSMISSNVKDNAKSKTAENDTSCINSEVNDNKLSTSDKSIPKQATPTSMPSSAGENQQQSEKIVPTSLARSHDDESDSLKKMEANLEYAESPQMETHQKKPVLLTRKESANASNQKLIKYIKILSRRQRNLKTENIKYKLRLNDVLRQNSDLRTTNQLLLDQNIRLRQSSKQVVAAARAAESAAAAVEAVQAIPPTTCTRQLNTSLEEATATRVFLASEPTVSSASRGQHTSVLSAAQCAPDITGASRSSYIPAAVLENSGHQQIAATVLPISAAAEMFESPVSLRSTINETSQTRIAAPVKLQPLVSVSSAQSNPLASLGHALPHQPPTIAPCVATGQSVNVTSVHHTPLLGPTTSAAISASEVNSLPDQLLSTNPLGASSIAPSIAYNTFVHYSV